MWFKENPEKMEGIDASFKWLQPIDIAQVMIEMCESDEYKGGEVVEVAVKGQKRKVGLFNDPGPFGMGETKGAKATVGKNLAAIIAREKGE